MKNKKKIFIPFIDGMLNYDCRDCGYFCCQTGFIILNAREKKTLLQKYPALRYFFVKEAGKTYWLKKYRRCWFLERDGLCHIQKKCGYSSKPFICRLHPFNAARCAGAYVVLLDICPALHVDQGNKNTNTSHKRIYKQIQEAIDNDIISEKIPWSASRLDLEKKVLDGSRIFLNSSSYLDFAAYQLSVTTKTEMAKTKSRLLEAVALWKSFFKIDQLNLDNRKLTHELVALTSVLRVGNYSFKGFRSLEEEKIPLALLALYFYMILFLKNRKADTCLETYTGVLNDISLTLLYLTKEDLKIKNRSLEAKLNYLRMLQKLYLRKLMPRA